MNKENKLYFPIAKWAKENEWEIWNEVSNLAVRDNNVVDTVIKYSNLGFAAIELKTSLNLTVLGQAYNNLPYFNMSIIGVPKRHSIDIGREFAHKICKDYGIGLIEMYEQNDEYKFAFNQPFVVFPKIKNRPMHGHADVRTWLRKEQKNFLGGTKNDYYSDRRKAFQQMEEYLKVSNIATIDDLLSIVGWYFKDHKTLFRNIRKDKRFKIFTLDNETFIKKTE